jgi:hypothetical protein
LSRPVFSTKDGVTKRTGREFQVAIRYDGEDLADAYGNFLKDHRRQDVEEFLDLFAYVFCYRYSYGSMMSVEFPDRTVDISTHFERRTTGGQYIVGEEDVDQWEARRKCVSLQAGRLSELVKQRATLGNE